MSGGDYPVILWWTPFMPEDKRYISCYNDKYTCLLTKNRTYHYDLKVDTYLFYGSGIENHDFPLPRLGKLWAVFHEESPRNYAAFLYENTQNLFNITATFSQNSDFPVTLQYLSNLEYLTDATKFPYPLEAKNKAVENEILAPVLYIQSDCDTPIDRDFLVQELMQYIKVDSYGKCLNNKEFTPELSQLYPLDLYNEALLKFISKYKFVIAIENAICDDYITEKFWRPLIAGSIPIYLGAPNIKEWLPNQNSAILINDFPNVKSLAQHIHIINSNDNLYQDAVRHKKGQIENVYLKNHLSQGPYGLETDQEHPISAFECFVCQKLHDGNTKLRINRARNQSIYNCPQPHLDNNRRKENTWNQHWIMGKCQAKALKELMEEDQPFSEVKFDNKWNYFFTNNNCD